MQSALVCGDESSVIREELIAQRQAALAALRERFKRAKKEGDLPTGADPADLARYVSAVASGMSVQAVNGASRAELLRLADTVVSGWPPPGTGT